MKDFNGGVRANPKINITDKDKAYLFDNYQALTLATLAKKLYVSQYKIQCWLAELNLHKPRVRRKSEKKEAVSTAFFEHDEYYKTL